MHRLPVRPLASDIDLIGLHRSAPDTFPFLLESVAAGHGEQHCDVLFAAPERCLTLWREDHGWVLLDELGDRVSAADDSADFLQALNQQFVADRASLDNPLRLPFVGGWFLFLGYELAAQVEPSLALNFREDLPVAIAARVRSAVIRRRGVRRESFLVSESERELSRLSAIVERLQPDHDRPGPAALDIALQEEPPASFLSAVSAAKRHIEAGDIYQANLSREWAGTMAMDRAADAYEALRNSNPAPFAALAVFDELAIASSSPERLVSIVDGRVETRPIAGTRPRHNDRETDSALLGQLLASEKEQAEHVMLIDLERNDLGRVCKAGSVKVDEFMVIESFAHVHHIVSNVVGELNDGVLPGDVIAAVFPGGTITGCPKVRCMALIAELEASPRGAYTGSIGYLGRDGNMDLNILIRTLTFSQGRVRLRAGAGIVADSEPAAELEETRAKARGLLLALGAPL